MSAVETDGLEVSAAELAAFTRQLGGMLTANVSVLRALQIASRYSGSDRLIVAADDVAAALTDGRELHQSLSRHPDLFDAFYIEMARQGETDGVLGEALLSVADYLDHREAKAAAQGLLLGAPAAPVVLGALGAASLGAAALWALSAIAVVPPAWLGPLAAAWVGAALLTGARLLSAAGRVPPAAPPKPVKTPERRRAEADGLVRSAVLEQEDAPPAAVGTPEPEESSDPAPGLNGKGVQESAQREPEPPRFSL